MSYFKETKRAFKDMFVQSSEKGAERYDLLEAAFFAYAHRNPLIDYLFWKRLGVAEKYVLAQDAKRVLDFGSGSGVMSYALGKSGVEVIAFDIDQTPLEEVKKSITFPATVTFETGNALDDPRFNASFDGIIALDVLEHIEDLTDFVALAKRVVKKGGFIVVSGPTENVLYKIGRWIAGKQFTGEYHVSNIRTIEARLAQDFEVSTIRTLFPGVPLFKLFVARVV